MLQAPAYLGRAAKQLDQSYFKWFLIFEPSLALPASVVSARKKCFLTVPVHVAHPVPSVATGRAIRAPAGRKLGKNTTQTNEKFRQR